MERIPTLLCVLAVAAFGGHCAHAQVITTVAGTGVPGSTGDGGQATAAQLANPNSVAVDAAGNLYIGEWTGYRVRRVAPNGAISTFAGTGVSGFLGDGGPAAAARIGSSGSLKFDAAGNLYIPDSGNHRVRRVAPNGVITTVAGNGVAAFAGDGGPATSASLNVPMSVDFDAAGNMYVGDSGNFRVRRVTPAGIIGTIAGTGVAGFSGDGGAATSAQLSNFFVVRVDSADAVYIADWGNHRVRRVSPTGVMSTVAGTGVAGIGGDGGVATAAQLNDPVGLAFDANGALYVSERAGARVRKVSGGIISTVAGTGVSGSSGDGGAPLSANINPDFDVAADASGNLYLGQFSFHRIRNVLQFAPSAPLIGTVSAGVNSVTVNFTPSGGPSPGNSYTATCGSQSATGPASPIVVSGLVSGQAVTCSVTATNVIGTSVASAASTSVTPTGAPVFTANSPPRYIVLNEPVSYVFRTSAEPAAGIILNSGNYPPGSSQGLGANMLLVNFGASPRGDYTYTIRASNAHGIADTTHTTSVVVQASPPTITSIARGSGSVTVNFNPPADAGGSPIQYFEAFCNTYYGSAGGAATAVTVAVPDNEAGSCVVRAYTAAREGFNSAAANFYLFGAPGAPNIGAVTTGDGQISVAFTPPADTGSSPISLYTANCNPSATASGTASPLLISGLSNGTTYNCSLSAANATGSGPPSFFSAVAGNPALITSAPLAPAASVGAAYAHTVTATGHPPPLLSITSGALPPGLTFDAVSGVISGAPTIGGEFAGTIQASNGVGNPSTQAFAITVGLGGVRPIFTLVGSGPAGNGLGGFSGDGGPANAAQLSVPWDTARDSAGNLYISDFYNNRVRKVTPAGVISTVGTALSPVGVAVDAAGNVYVSEPSFHRIRRINAGGGSSFFAGTGTAGFSGDGGQATAANLNFPGALAIGASGVLYISDGRNHRIRTVNAAGVINTIAGNGTAGFSGDGGPAVAASLRSPGGMGFDAAGGFIIGDTGNFRLRRVDNTGVISTLAGTGFNGVSGDGGPATSAGIRVGGGNIAVDAAGNVYFAGGSNNGQVRMIDAAGVINTFAGNGANGFSGDGGPKLAATLSAPSAVLVDAQGNILITDSYNNRIRKVPVVGPGSPEIGMATPGIGQVSVAFTVPANESGSAISGYTATCGAQSASGAATPIVVSGLANGVAVDCRVLATNAVGNSPWSAASNVVTPGAAPQITGASPPNGTWGQPYAHTIVATGAPAPTFTVSAGMLPTGLALDAVSGAIVGTPTVAATFGGTFTATNGVGAPATQAFSIAIAPVVPGAPTGLTASAGDGSAALAFMVPASDGGSAILDYAATCDPGAIGATGGGSGLVVTGLANNVAYVCTVRARNAVGLGAASTSATVIPGTGACCTDLSITKSNATTFVSGGLSTDYAIDVANNSPTGVVGARVQDALDASFGVASWTCAAFDGAQCASGGLGSIDTLVDLPGNSHVRIVLTAAVVPLPEDPVSNIASVTPPAGIADVATDNNVASDGPDTRGVFRDGFD